MSVKNSQKLKQLNSRLSRVRVDIDHAESDKQEIIKRISDLRNQEKQIQAEINKLTQRELLISEHAMLRYLEHVMGLDVEQLVKDMLDESTRETIRAMGNGKYPIANGAKAVVKDNRVVTVIGKKGK